MPQLLSALRPHEIGGVGEIDWGTLAVYTCTGSCDGSLAEGGERTGSGYMREVVWRQGL